LFVQVTVVLGLIVKVAGLNAKFLIDTADSKLVAGLDPAVLLEVLFEVLG
jgi:hypothetical protein